MKGFIQNCRFKSFPLKKYFNHLALLGFVNHAAPSQDNWISELKSFYDFDSNIDSWLNIKFQLFMTSLYFISY